MLFGRTDEAVDVAPDAQPRALAAATELVARGARAAVVTAAAAGAAVAWAAKRRGSPAPRVQVVNPIGAGDVLTAALAAALERGAELVDAVARGRRGRLRGGRAPGGGPVRPRPHARPARRRAPFAYISYTGVGPRYTDWCASSGQPSRRARGTPARPRCRSAQRLAVGGARLLVAPSRRSRSALVAGR